MIARRSRAEVEDAVAAHPDVVAVDGFRGVDVPYGDALIIVGSGRFEVISEHGTLLFKSPADGRRALADAIGDRAVVVSESFSLKYDTTVGDSINLLTDRGVTAFHVAAVYY